MKSNDKLGSINYMLSGKILDIDIVNRTITVEATFGEKHFSVRGYISAHAVFRKGNRLGKLEDFIVGDSVVVRYQISNQGDIIEAIESV
jgi:hypothetical protein